MKFLALFLATIFATVACTPAPSKVDVVSETRSANPANQQDKMALSLIRKIDFQNFTFPWTKTFGHGEKPFTLKSGTGNSSDGRRLTLKSLTYISVVSDSDEQALVNVNIDDGNATYEMLYIYAVENDLPRLLESFEFGENNVYFGTAFGAHGELVIETYNQQPADPECCPSIIEISYYKWQKNKFVLQGESQKIANGYVERGKRSK